jgi:hypothetical protein
MMKIFYDYTETQFTVNGSDTLLNNYLFSLNAMESTIIPIVLDNNLTFNNSHLLTVAVFTAPNNHAIDLNIMTDQYGVSITFELNNKNGERRINEIPTPQEPSEFLQITYQGLMLNLDFNAKDDIQVLFPPLEIKARSGEAIKLAYRAGNYDNAEDVLFIIMLDWQQQIFDGKPFIHIKNMPDYMGYGIIEITAPLEKGKYDITGFIVSNPFELRNGYNFISNDASYRFTLIVE